MNTWDTNNVTLSGPGLPYPDPSSAQQYHPPRRQQQHGHGHRDGQKGGSAAGGGGGGGNKHYHQHPRTTSANAMALTPTSSSNGAARGDLTVAPGVRKQFLRTKLCKHFLRGCCLYGDKCTYAHDYSQIQVRPDLRKTKMCQANLEGRCPYRAEECQFAHSTEDLKATPGLFKTVLCSWWQKGKCDMGDKCRFAHGEQELQRPSAPSGPENISITPGSTPLQNPMGEDEEVSSVESGEAPRSTTPPGLHRLDNLPPVSHIPTPPQMQQRPSPQQQQQQQSGMPNGAYPDMRPAVPNVFAPPPEIAVSPAEVLKYQQNQFASVLSGSLAAAAQAAAMQQRPTQDPTAYAAQQQQQWAIAAAAATAATAAVASIAGGFEPTPAQLQNLSLIAARSLHQQAAMQQMYISYSTQQQQAMMVQQQAAAALAAQQWQRQQQQQMAVQQQQGNVSPQEQQRYDQYQQQQQQQQRGDEEHQQEQEQQQEQQQTSLHTSASAPGMQHKSEAAVGDGSPAMLRTASDQQLNLRVPVITPEIGDNTMRDYPSSSNLSDMASATATEASATEFGDVAAPLPNIKSSAAILSGSGLQHVASMSIPQQSHLDGDDGDAMTSTSNLMKAFASSPALCTVGSLLGLSNQAEPLSAEEEAELAEFGALSELYSQDPSVQVASPNYHTVSMHHNMGGLAQSASFNCFPSLLASVGESPRPRAGSDPAMHGHDEDHKTSDVLFAELQNLVRSQNRSGDGDVH